MTKWAKIIEENRAEIEAKAKEAFRDSRRWSSGFGKYHRVVLHQDGDVYGTYEDQSDTNGEVWNGRAVYVYGIRELDIIKEGDEDLTGLTRNQDGEGYYAQPYTWMAAQHGTETIIPEETIDELRDMLIGELWDEDEAPTLEATLELLGKDGDA